MVDVTSVFADCLQRAEESGEQREEGGEDREDTFDDAHGGARATTSAVRELQRELLQHAAGIAREIGSISRGITAASPTQSAPEALIRRCCENVDAFKQLVEAACDKEREAKSRDRNRDGAQDREIDQTGTAAHLRAIVASLYSRLEEVADAAMKRRALVLAKERARAARYAPARQSASTPPVAALSARGSHPPLSAVAASGLIVDSAATGSEVDGGGHDNELVMENQMLARKMGSSTVEALKAVERQVAEISEMQRIVASKVLEQAQDMDALHEQADRSVSAVSESNARLLRETRRKRKLWWADCNTIVSGSLIAMGASILFLNWIHP